MRSSTPLRVCCALVASLSLAAAAAADLGIETTKAVACTRKTLNGDLISVHYTGSLQSDGSVFDSSIPRGAPFEFMLGASQVIRGWDEGLLGMCIGEARRLTIPPEMGYGIFGQGSIPGGATLIFETELMGILGVVPEPTVVAPGAPANDSSPTSSPPNPTTIASAPVPASNITAKPEASDASPMDTKDAECHLLGPYALFVQAALGLLAVSALVIKRWRETPRRPLKIWFFDVSKQVAGSAMLHLANVLMSMLSSGHFDVDAKAAALEGDQPNPCSFYLLNITIDTTIGIPILVLLLRLLHAAFMLTPLASPPESIRSGNYGHPPRASWWLKQSFIYFLGLIGMKTCVFFIFKMLPWIAWVGDWALRWTEGNEAIQITFVMFIFPLVMNALQYWIIDGFIKDRDSGEGGYEVANESESESDDEDDGGESWLERRRRSGDDEREQGREMDEGVESAGELEEANPTALPVRSLHKDGKTTSKRRAEYDPHVGSAGGARAGGHV